VLAVDKPDPGVKRLAFAIFSIWKWNYRSLGGNARVFRDMSQHSGADFFAVVKCKDNIRPPLA
jgi:hypothetical protein